MWVPWRRPGFQLGLDIAAITAANPQAIGVVLGGHGITAWGATSDECEAQLAGDHPHRGGVPRRARPRRSRSARSSPGYEPLPEAERRARAAALAPLLRGLASTDRPQVGHFTDSRRGARLPGPREAPARWPRSARRAPTTSCAPRSARWCSTCRRRRRSRRSVARLRGAARGLPRGLPRLLRAARRRRTRPAMRGADPAIVLVPGVGHVLLRHGQADRAGGRRVLRQRDQRDARRRGGLDLRADRREREVPHRVLGARGGQARADAASRSRWPPGSRWSPARGSGIGRAIAHRLAAEGACVVVADLDADDGRRRSRRRSAAARRRRRPCTADVTDARRGRRGVRRGRAGLRRGRPVVNNAGLSISKPLLETTEPDWDLQHDVMAKGSFLVSREAAPGDDRAGAGRRHRLHLAARTRSSPGPNNVAYGAAKADQAHQVRLLAAELGEHGIRVNGINPDGVVRGSGIFAGGWGAQRAAVYGVPEEELGAFYAQRTLLKREVLPEHVAAAVFALTGGDLTPHHRLHIPVDAGVAAAFLRWDRRSATSRRASPRRPRAPPAAGSWLGARRAGDGLELHEVHRFRQRAGAARGDAALGHPRLYAERRWTACALAARTPGGWTASASTPGRSTTGCSTRPARCSATRSTTATRRTDGVDGSRAGRGPAPSCTPSTGCSSCRSTRSTSSAAARQRLRLQAADTLLLIPDLLGVLAHRRARRRGHQRLHHRAARRPHAATGPTELIDRLGLRAGLLPAAARAGRRRSGRCWPRRDREPGCRPGAA